ncbi:MAG: hypothetical protein WB988_25290 [Candidatus Nitrosopolaris sp.]
MGLHMWVFVACSNNPFKLEDEADESILYSFLGHVRDRLLYLVTDPHERIVPPIIKWVLTGCDINKDITVTDMLQLSAINIQLKDADKIVLDRPGLSDFCLQQVPKVCCRFSIKSCFVSNLGVPDIRQSTIKHNYHYFLKDNVEHFCSKDIVSLLHIDQNISRIWRSICVYYRHLFLPLPFLVL